LIAPAATKLAKTTDQLRRVLVVDPNTASAKMLAELLRSLIPNCQVHVAPNEARAMRILEALNPQLIFVECKGPELDGLSFTRTLRRSDLSVRTVPVIAVTAEATAAAIMGARDAGVHEFLRRPFNMGDLKKRLDAIVLKPREWIEAVNYVGPDRRRFNSADYKGPRKRRGEGGPAIFQRIAQAIKIVQSAVGALESDPSQALRALDAQARILAGASAGRESLRGLEAAALALEDYLLRIPKTQTASRTQIEALAAQIYAATPQDAVDKAA
jgi:CheY-like chemotaxis protein